MKKKKKKKKENKTLNQRKTPENISMKCTKIMYMIAKMTWGDLYRLFKYYIRFATWDGEIGTRSYRVFPNQLTKE